MAALISLVLMLYSPENKKGSMTLICCLFSAFGLPVLARKPA